MWQIYLHETSSSRPVSVSIRHLAPRRKHPIPKREVLWVYTYVLRAVFIFDQSLNIVHTTTYEIADLTCLTRSCKV